MMQLKFDGNGTMKELFARHAIEIFDSVVDAIAKVHQQSKVEGVDVILASIEGIEYIVHLHKKDFVSSLNSAIAAYEGAEAYEKCQQCVILINKLKAQANCRG